MGIIQKFSLAIILTAIAVIGISAQDGGAIRPSAVTGDVITVSTTAIELKTEAGRITVELNDKTTIKRVHPENPTLNAAVAAQIIDISTGDKLLVTGVFSNDRKRLPARAVYLMSQSDIAKRQQEEAQRWATRGISGRVASVNQDTKQISIEVRGLMGTTPVVINPKDEAVFKQYAPNSVKYSETIPSSLANIQAGDMLRALGDRSGDGSSFMAEEILTGAFQTIVGTVKSVNAENGEVLITNLQSEGDITVQVGPSSNLRRFPAEMAMRMAGGGTPGQGGAGPADGQGQGGQRPDSAAGGQAGGPGRGMGPMNARGGVDDMFERFPAIATAELQVGDMIAVSSSKNGTPDRVTAIKLLAGVEPFVRAAQAAGQLQRGRGGAAASGGFTIPGLDGLDFP